MHRAYRPQATWFERTRCRLAGFLIPIVWGLALVTLRLLPRTHPFRIYTTDRIQCTRELARRAVGICNEGRLVPIWLVAASWGYLALSALSPRVIGPFDLFNNWTLDDHVRIIDRVVKVAEAAPAFLGLSG